MGTFDCLVVEPSRFVGELVMGVRKIKDSRVVTSFCFLNGTDFKLSYLMGMYLLSISSH